MRGKYVYLAVKRTFVVVELGKLERERKVYKFVLVWIRSTIRSNVLLG